ncbi:hypothetical protein GCM10023189_33610 [Nibrella saemangeumensis]|uniref:Uncharacterized protein n=1 Tax=Nibrella saemangeumensis TaxID=1084526 RepID=A0ABP8N1F6_9BACT
MSTEFKARWKFADGAEHANDGVFLQDLCDLELATLTALACCGKRRRVTMGVRERILKRKLAICPGKA